MINMNDRQNEYRTDSPLRLKSGSNIAKLLLHMRFLFLKTEVAVFMRILAKTGILTHISAFM